jgi:hypothetical protein
MKVAQVLPELQGSRPNGDAHPEEVGGLCDLEATVKTDVPRASVMGHAVIRRGVIKHVRHGKLQVLSRCATLKMMIATENAEKRPSPVFFSACCTVYLYPQVVWHTGKVTNSTVQHVEASLATPGKEEVEELAGDILVCQKRPPCLGYSPSANKISGMKVCKHNNPAVSRKTKQRLAIRL